MLSIDLSGKRAFVAGVADDGGFGFAIAKALAEAGDDESARVCQIVHDEEIVHVALAAHWIGRLGEPTRGAASESDLDHYLAAVPFPLGPARAKGRRFELAPRRRAGLSEALIEYVRTARSSQETSGRAPRRERE